MIQAMYSGVSGMKAFKTQLDVIGNNVANLNTIGFKGSRVTFQEMLNQTMRSATAPSPGRGGSNPVQVGLGVNIGSIDVNQMQGSLQATGKLTDVAIEGSGFFILGSSDGMAFSRDGTFSVDSDFNLVNSSGLPVLGWSADPLTGEINTDQQITSASMIRIPIGQLSVARQTSILRFGGNLDASAAVGDTTKTSTPIYDSLGVSHQVDVTFEKTGPSEWSYTITSAETTPTQIGTGTIAFDSFGKSTLDTINASMTLTNGNGSIEPINFDISFASTGQLDENTPSAPPIRMVFLWEFWTRLP
jgi:flagellar hook protein FlgE